MKKSFLFFVLCCFLWLMSGCTASNQVKSEFDKAFLSRMDFLNDTFVVTITENMRVSLIDPLSAEESSEIEIASHQSQVEMMLAADFISTQKYTYEDHEDYGMFSYQYFDDYMIKSTYFLNTFPRDIAYEVIEGNTSLYTYVFGDLSEDMTFYDDATFEDDTTEGYILSVPYASIINNPLFYLSGNTLEDLKRDHPTFYVDGGLVLDYPNITDDMISLYHALMQIIFDEDLNRITIHLELMSDDSISTESGDLKITSDITIYFGSIDKDSYIQHNPIMTHPATQSKQFLVRKIWEHSAEIHSFSYMNTDGWLKISFDSGDYVMDLADLPSFSLVELYDDEQHLIHTFSNEDTTFSISKSGVYALFIQSSHGKIITINFEKQ